MFVGFACLCATCQHASGALPSGGAPEAGSWGGPCIDGYAEIEPLAVSGEGRLVRFCADAENLWYYADIEGDGEDGYLQVTIPRHPADFRQYDYSACLWTNVELPNHPWPESVGFVRTWHASATEDSRTFVFSWHNLESRAAYFGFYGEVNGRPYSEPSACVHKADRREHLAQTPHLDRLHTKLVKYVPRDDGEPDRPRFDKIPSDHERVYELQYGRDKYVDRCFREDLDHTMSDGRITKICGDATINSLSFHFSGVDSGAVLVVDVPYDYIPPVYMLNGAYFLTWDGFDFEGPMLPAYVTHTTNSYQTMVFDIPRGLESMLIMYCWWCPGANQQPQALVPLPGEQLAAGVPPGEVRCIIGHALMLGPDGDAACVDERSVEILQRRGFEVP